MTNCQGKDYFINYSYTILFLLSIKGKQ